MALSFPPSPAIGDIYLQWQWNGSAWGPIPGGSSGGSVSITAGAGVTVSPSPLTGTGTVALSTPVAISAGGTSATTAGAAFNAIAASGGTIGGTTRINGDDVLQLRGTANSRISFQNTGMREWRVGQTSDQTWHIADQSVPAVRFIVDASGMTYNTSGSWATICDMRMKEEVAEYEHGLVEIRQLRPIVFSYTGPAGTLARADESLHVGLVADEVESVMPECVGTAELEDAGTVKTLDNGPLLYALINAIKTLNERLTAAEAQITGQGMKH